MRFKLPDMSGRRKFLKVLSGATIPAGMALLPTGVARADDTKYLGAWMLIHPGPFGNFREYNVFATGGALNENNSFIHAGSKVNLTGFNLPWAAISGNDGVGTWAQGAGGLIQFLFRKLLFNSGVYFGDLKVTGSAHSDGRNLSVTWTSIEIVDPNNNDAVLANLGSGTSLGSTRIG